MIMRCGIRIVLALWLLFANAPLAAQTRAWLDRDRIALGETVTLNIETTGNDAPDYAPLRRGFELSAHTSRQQFELSGGRAVSRTLYGVALRPRREGLVTIPALAVGRDRTSPLSLRVTAGRADVLARAGDDVFIESGPDDPDPYVQQSVGWVVRLYTAVPIVSGQLDQPAPDGATLQRVGDDAQYTRDLGNRRYKVVERRYLLVPERSGPLAMPGAVFEGRGIAGFFDRLLGNADGALAARAAPRVLQVRGVPANAPQPWLPLHSLRLRHVSVPRALRAGSAAVLMVEITADGASAAQLPELPLPAIDGVQVFAEPVQADERFVDGRPRATLVRRFSLVPTRAGAVRLPELRIPWWDVRAGQARMATLPGLAWQVAPAAGGAPAQPAAETAPTAGVRPSDARLANRYWVLAALVFAAMWLFTLVWGLQRRTGAGGASTAGVAGGVPLPAPAKRAPDFARLLVAGDLGEIVPALQAMARPPAHDVDELRARLDDPAQIDALDALERARWGGGDARAARTLLQAAFAGGPRWKPSVSRPDGALPPLYPPADRKA